jgi:hypothetical protein
MKAIKSLLCGVAVAAACFVLPHDAEAAWIGTPAGAGTIQSITSWNMHNYFYTNVRISSSFPNCGTTVRDAVIAKRTPSGGVNETHDVMLNLAMSAYLSGKRVSIWTENLTYTIFGSPTTVCVIQQIMVE